MASEVELKLAAAAVDLPRLKRALRDLVPDSACRRSALTTTYYDTADRVLSRRGLSLRVRAAEGRFVQTVKSNGAAEAGILMRGEWEDEIAGGEPDLNAPHSGCCLPNGIAGCLQPLFATAVMRTTIDLNPSPSLSIEAAIDEGEIRSIAGVATAPISEIELELKRGDRGALFDIALDLLAAAPLRVETRSKAQRGYAALEGAVPQPVAAASIALDSAMTTETALQMIGTACLTHLLRNQAAALAGDPGGIHQMRVAARRIRSAILAFKKMLPPAERRRATDELDWLDEILGPTRNLDVFASELLAPRRSALSGNPGLDRIAAAVEAARQAAYARVRELVPSARCTEAELRLLRWFAVGCWRIEEALPESDLSTAIGDIAPQVLDRRLRSVRRRGKGFREASAKERHKLRIAVKELRYTGELLGSLFDPRDVRDFAKPLRKLQDGLGYANDVRVGHDVVDQIAATAADKEAIKLAGARVLGWHEHAVEQHERKVRKYLRGLYRAAPFWKPRPPPGPTAISDSCGQATRVSPTRNSSGSPFRVIPT